MFMKHKLKGCPLNFRKRNEISASTIKPFSSYAQENHLGGHKFPPPGQIELHAFFYEAQICPKIKNKLKTIEVRLQMQM